MIARKYGLLLWAALAACSQPKQTTKAPKSFSGVYPALAMYNNEGECGTGAVVPWAGKLWVITYGPHLPNGSSDKLYEISPDLTRVIRQESIGGTPANRMIHPESDQLFIGPYAIDGKGNVRTIPYTQMPGRHTANARHLTDPANKIYYGTMEEGFYEVDVKTLKSVMLYPDANPRDKFPDLLPGAHGKGMYSGQGVLVYSDNGEPGPKSLVDPTVESGSLHEWDGKNWKLIRRNQFTEITGPGGIRGNQHPDKDPIWSTGWDHRSLLLAVRDNGAWHFYRMPKASHSYDGAHGWNTEWPRIRDIGTDVQPDYLMTMHGMFWHFPGDFSSTHSAGIRPRSAYLKVIGDFTRWNEQLVFGCDDSAQKEFLNKRKAKGGIEGPGQSNSNLWFTGLQQPDQLGPNTAEGAVWMNDNVKANEPSEPFLFAGWPVRTAWVQNNGKSAVQFTFETDNAGDNKWSKAQTITVAPGASAPLAFPSGTAGEWIRVVTNANTNATVHFAYAANDKRNTTPDNIFKGLSKTDAANSIGGLLYGLGKDRRVLGFLNGSGYYELNEQMELQQKQDTAVSNFIRTKFAIPQQAVEIDAASVLVVDDKGRRWRLPFGPEAFTGLTQQGMLRVCREVATERDLFNCHGTFYELPAENADGYAKIRPVASHNFRINDYASYRGLLILTGLDADTKSDHIIRSEDGKAAVWAGVIDDLWKLGKPVGHGGPWKDADVKANIPSDAFLFGFYDDRNLTITHKATQPVTFTIELDPSGTGTWMKYRDVTVAPNEAFRFQFPAEAQARWIRFVSNKDCNATAQLEYK